MESKLIEINIAANTLKGIGGWRLLYLDFIRAMRPVSLVEIGSGDPKFLKEAARYVEVASGLDANPHLVDLYRDAGIEFTVCDFDHGSMPEMARKFAVAICSDVFEHLLYPSKTLGFIKEILKDEAVLFSHVPNEFSLSRTMRIMAGRREAVYFHKTCEEWDNPHIRRFTNKGYKKFLEQMFKYNLKLSDLRLHRYLKFFTFLKLGLPYCLEGGPTYASTNNENVYTALKAIKKELSVKWKIST